MKLIKFISILGFVFFMFLYENPLYAQISKAEAKALKKQLKKMSLEEYAELRTSVNTLRKNTDQLESRLKEINKIKKIQTQKANLLMKQLNESQESIVKLKTERETSDENIRNQGVKDAVNVKNNKKVTRINGIIFRVQIGAFKNEELANYFPDNSNFDGQTSLDIESYTVGSFSDYWEADAFKKLIRKMGASDVRVIPYKDGLRTPLREILEALRL